MKIISFDIETAPDLVATFSLYPDSIPHTAIIQDWYVIAACWKELGKEEVESAYTYIPTSDYVVVEKLRNALASADIIVAHNGKKFDLKKLNARLIYHNLPPLPSIPIVDTLIEVKKVAQFTSHRLDYLGKHLLGAGKLPTSDGLWIRALKGEIAAIDEMVKYCKVDVLRLEALYLKLRPYMKQHPHVGVLEKGEKKDCPRCGSLQVIKAKVRVSASGTRTQQYQCKSCGGYHSTSITKKDEAYNETLS